MNHFANSSRISRTISAPGSLPFALSRSARPTRPPSAPQAMRDIACRGFATAAAVQAQPRGAARNTKINILLQEEKLDIDVIFKIAGIGIMVTVVNQVLSKNGRDDIAVMVNLAGIVIVLLTVIDMISELFGVVRSVFNLY